jgi:hypothetical protein
MLSGFKQFVLRGNVVDLAVGVVIGAAFGGVVNAFTKAFLTPFIDEKVRVLQICPHPPWHLVSGGGIHRRISFVCAHCGHRIFLCGHAGECVAGSGAEGACARRSHDQEVSGMPERDSHRSATMFVLCAAGARRQSGLKYQVRSCTMKRCFAPLPRPWP